MPPPSVSSARACASGTSRGSSREPSHSTTRCQVIDSQVAMDSDTCAASSMGIVERRVDW
jgi:hypothetical protein